MNLYADLGYVYGENYHFKVDKWDVKGLNIYDLSLGTSISYHLKNSTIFFNLNASNLYDGVIKESRLGGWSTKFTSIPFITLSIGYNEYYKDYVFSTAFSYLKNIKGKDSFKNYTLSASISKMYRNFTLTAGSGILRKNSKYYYLSGNNFINENIINIELNLSYTYKFISPYISFYHEIFSKSSIYYLNMNKGSIIRTGICLSTSKITSGLKSIGRIVYPQSHRIYNMMNTLKKPNIYLYPPKDQTVKVKLNERNNSRITESIPEYNDGWNVFVQKNGRIDEKYDYLFYEGDITKPKNLKRGWCVEKKDIIPFFEKTLYKYGFNIKEVDDFIEYWSIHLPDGKYYEVYPIIDKEIDKYFPLEITPKPDSIRRLWFYVIPANSMKNLKPPELKKFSREGFTVAEWGLVLE